MSPTRRFLAVVLVGGVALAGCGPSPTVYRYELPPAVPGDVAAAYVLNVLEESDCQISYDDFHTRLQNDGSFDAAARAERNNTSLAIEQLAARSTADAVVTALIDNGAVSAGAISDSTGAATVITSNVGNCA